MVLTHETSLNLTLNFSTQDHRHDVETSAIAVLGRRGIPIPHIALHSGSLPITSCCADAAPIDAHVGGGISGHPDQESGVELEAQHSQMAESFSHAMSSSVLLRWVVFEDEAAATSARGRRALEYWPQAILRRPSFVTRRQEWECVAKVRLARVRPPATHVVYPC